jgi:hypothetical protein
MQYGLFAVYIIAARAALMTGRLGLRTGVTHNFSPGSIAGLPTTEITIAVRSPALAVSSTAPVRRWKRSLRIRALPWAIPLHTSMARSPAHRAIDTFRHTSKRTATPQPCWVSERTPTFSEVVMIGLRTHSPATAPLSSTAGKWHMVRGSLWFNSSHPSSRPPPYLQAQL